MEWITRAKIPIGRWAQAAIGWIAATLTGPLDAFAEAVAWLIDSMPWALQAPPPLAVVAAAGALAYSLQRSWKLSALVVAGLLFIIAKPRRR